MMAALAMAARDRRLSWLARTNREKPPPLRDVRSCLLAVGAQALWDRIQQLACIGLLRRRIQGVGITLLHHLTVVHHHDFVAHVFDDGEVM